jgi:hypothetical protein
MLNQSGLGNALAPLAKTIGTESIQNAAASGGLGAALQSAMGSAGSTSLGAGLGAVAQQAYNEGAGLAGFNLGAGGALMASSGGGGGGGGAAAAPSFNLPSFGAGGEADRGLAGGTGTTTEFQGNPSDSDIWHGSTEMNLFQIVSKRIVRTSSRMGL